MCDLSNKKLFLDFLFSSIVTVDGSVCFKASSDRAKTKSDLMALFLFSHHSCSHLNLCADSTETGWRIPILGEHRVDVQRSLYTPSWGNRRDRAVKTIGLLCSNSRMMEKLRLIS